ncbi:MAG: HD domain-containing protein [Chloroflexi bacterium]|nr:HD domain-containing protein [Chloroflexota bacterium]
MKATLTHIPSNAMDSVLIRASKVLSRQRGRAYIVGGYVRDLLLGRPTNDVDITLVEGDSLGTARALADALGGAYYPLNEERRVGRALLTDSQTGATFTFDISRTDSSLEEDLARRDFTIDAMALPLGADRTALIDPFHGQDDIAARRIRALREEVLVDDPARLLRAVRLAGQLRFAIEERTHQWIQAHAGEVARVSGERVRDEIVRILALPDSLASLRLLDALGLLCAVFPELAPAKGVSQTPEHYWDVFDHCLETVGYLERIFSAQTRIADPTLSEIPWDSSLDQYFATETSTGRSLAAIAKLAALFHDVAKPQTKSLEPTGRTRFLGHATQGAEVLQKVMERLHLSRHEVRLGCAMVEDHLRPMQVSQNLEPPTRRAVYRYHRDLEEAATATLYLSLADYLAARGPRIEEDDWRQHTRLIAAIQEMRSQDERIVAPPKLVTGTDLMEALRLPPGPRVGELLEAVREAQAAGEVSSRDEALALAQRLQSETKAGNVVEKEPLP